MLGRLKKTIGADVVFAVILLLKARHGSVYNFDRNSSKIELQYKTIESKRGLSDDERPPAIASYVLLQVRFLSLLLLIFVMWALFFLFYLGFLSGPFLLSCILFLYLILYSTHKFTTIELCVEVDGPSGFCRVEGVDAAD